MQNITPSMKDYIELVNKNLNEYMIIEYPQEIFEAMRYTVLLPGKRLRPVLCLEACRIFGGDIEQAVAAACAVEMLHAQTLIHDDLPCMDNDDFRRGKPSNHKVFGEANAVLAGDALLSFAPQIILEKSKKLSSDTVLKLLKEFYTAAGAFGVIAGQVVDIQSENSRISSRSDQENKNLLEFIHTHKTADLFKLALRSGAIIADAGDENIAKITEFGQYLGCAFQIADDILDETATFEQLGKTPHKDENAGKLTYTSLYGLEEAKKKLNTLIDECYKILDDCNVKSEVFNNILEHIRIK